MIISFKLQASSFKRSDGVFGGVLVGRAWRRKDRVWSYPAQYERSLVAGLHTSNHDDLDNLARVCSIESRL